MSALNINIIVGCDRCANRERCGHERPLLPLLVFLKTKDQKCECFKWCPKEEREAKA